MDKNKWTPATVGFLTGLVLLIAGIFAFFIAGGATASGIYLYMSVAIAGVLIAIGVTFVVLLRKGKISNTEPDYRTLFIMGVIFTGAGVSINMGVSAFGVILMIVGIANRKKWKEQPKFSEMSPGQKKLKIVALVLLGTLVLASFVAWYVAAR